MYIMVLYIIYYITKKYVGFFFGFGVAWGVVPYRPPPKKIYTFSNIVYIGDV